MKTKIILVSISVFLYLLFHTPATRAEALPSIIISEIQITGTRADDEFVRLKNETDAAVNLTGFRLTKKLLSGGACKESALVSTQHFQGNIQPKSSFLIAHPDYKNSYHADLDYSSASYYLSDNTVVLLYNKAGELLDRRAIGNACDITLPAPPPVTPPVPDPPAPSPGVPKETKSALIRINEIFPNPKAKSDAGEFIELYNFGAAPADISGWILRDATKTGKYVFPAGTLLAEAGYLSVTDQSFKLALNNSSETISLFDDADMLIDSVRYEKTKEDVSLNYTATGWRGGTPTPGASNLLNNLPETKEKVPKKGYHGVAVDFDARGRDTDHDTLKYTWDFGDGHKSYKEKTSHAYEENGTYTVTLTISDGKDDTIETFLLEIKNSPHLEIRITSLMPNPDGNDTANEWIMLENREKKTVNLKGYGIATGWKVLSNHPIREDFFIAPKSEAKLTRAFSLFTLPNQKGKIELRAPDGKVLQEIKYKLEKSIAENAVYQKKKGEKWKFEEAAAKSTPATDTPTETDEETNDDSLVLGVSDTIQDKSTEPEAETVPGQMKENIENQLSLDPDRPLPQDILAYGTRVQVPDTIAFTPISAQEIAPLPETDSLSLSITERLASHINASLNELLNDSQEK